MMTVHPIGDTHYVQLIDLRVKKSDRNSYFLAGLHKDSFHTYFRYRCPLVSLALTLFGPMRLARCEVQDSHDAICTAMANLLADPNHYR